MVHEARENEDNCFLTLTYSPENLPKNGSLNKEDIQKFFKRLRKKIDKPIRYYQCGEYGDKFARPHHHICLFGHKFDDKELWKTKKGIPLYTSKKLEKLWGLGYCTLGDVTFESAAYIARYCTKKITGKLAEDHYERIDTSTGECIQIKPEYSTMSNGIGKKFYEKYKQDIYSMDSVLINPIKKTFIKPPRYYDGKYEIEYPEDFKKIKKTRTLRAHKNSINNTSQRLLAREKLHIKKSQLLKRGYEK